MLSMAKKNPKQAEAQDRKPYRTVRVRGPLVKQLEKMMEARASDLTEEVNTAVREYLERAKLWPPSENTGG